MISRTNTGSPIRPINVVTVCVSFSALLAECAKNVKGIRRFVVTAPDDTKTQRLCEAEGLTCVVARCSKAFGTGFHAAHNKSKWINEGLKAVRQQLKRERAPKSDQSARWVLILDADILLPEDFGERLANLLPHLDEHKVYGLRGRRVANTKVEFEALRHLAPWADLAEQSPIPLGYFQLFHLDHPNAKYPPSDKEGIGHDDVRFCTAFGSENFGVLPFSGLHLGSANIHWGGRQEDIGAETRSFSQSTAQRTGLDLQFPNQIPKGDALVLGPWRIAAIRVLSQRHQSVFLEDTENIGRKSSDPLVEADRLLQWQSLMLAMEALPNVFVLKTTDLPDDRICPGAKIVSKPPAQLDHIHVEAEPTHKFLIEELGKWTSALAVDGWITGRHYGYPGYPRATATIELLSGTPIWRNDRGQWAHQKRATVLAKHENTRGDDGRGVVLWVWPGDEQATIVALHQLSKNHQHNLAVLEWGAVTAPLHIACAKYGVRYINAVEEALKREDGPLINPLEKAKPVNFVELPAALLTLGYSPFTQTLMTTVSSGLPPVHEWWKALSKKPCAIKHSDASLPYTPTEDKRAVGLWPIAFDQAHPEFDRWVKTLRASGGIRKEHPFASFQRMATLVSLKAESLSLVGAETDADFLAQNKVHVWMPNNVTVATAVTPPDVEAFQKNWDTIRWRPDLVKMIVPFVDQTELFEERVPDAVICKPKDRILSEYANEPYWNIALITAAQKAKTEYVLYLDPCMSPNGGAEVFANLGENTVLGAGGWAFARRGTSVLKIAKLGPPATVVHRKWFLRALSAFQSQRRENSLEVFLHGYAKKGTGAVSVQDLFIHGWNR